MLGFIPNFLSRLRKKRHWCDFFSTASVWADHVRSSVMWTQRNLKPFTRSTGVLLMWWVCVLCSVSWNPPPAPWSCRCWVRVQGFPYLEILTPFSQGTHLCIVGCLIVVSDQVYHRCVVSVVTLELCVAAQSCVYREYRSGLRTQPCGAPVLRVSGDEVLLPILTTWLLPVRKSRIQLHRDLFSPRVWSFTTSVAGTMVLNAEL